MKSLLIAGLLLLIPTFAYAYDHKWSNNYVGIAGGSMQDQDSVKALAVQRAHDAATKAGGCSHNPYGDEKNGVQVGQVELPTTCQCVDNVCICHDELEVVCLSQEK